MHVCTRETAEHKQVEYFRVEREITLTRQFFLLLSERWCNASEKRQKKSRPLSSDSENLVRRILLIVHAVFEMLTHGSIRNDMGH